MPQHSLGMQGLNQFANRQAAPQAPYNQGLGGTNLGGANPESIARLMVQQRELEAAQQAAQQHKLLQQHRLLQMQVRPQQISNPRLHLALHGSCLPSARRSLKLTFCLREGVWCIICRRKTSLKGSRQCHRAS